MANFFIDHIVNDGDKFEIKLEKGAFIEIGSIGLFTDPNNNKSTLIGVINGGVYEVGQQLLLEGTSVVIALRVEINGISGNSLFVNFLPELSVGTIKEYRIYKLAFRFVSLANITQQGTGLKASNLNKLLDRTGDTMTGLLNMGGNPISNLNDPAVGTQAATKNYVDNKRLNIRNRASGTNYTSVGSGSGTESLATSHTFMAGDIIEFEITTSSVALDQSELVRIVIGTNLSSNRRRSLVNGGFIEFDVDSFTIFFMGNLISFTQKFSIEVSTVNNPVSISQEFFVGNIWFLGNVDD